MTKSSVTPLGAALAAVIFLLGGCGVKETPGKHEDTAKAKNPLAIRPVASLLSQIKVGTPKWKEVTGTFEVPGRVEADATRLARIGSPVTGRITNLLALEGEHVKDGQVLATLHSTELSDAQFAFIKAYSQSRILEQAAARAKQLVSADVIGTAELQRREAELLQATAEVASLRNQLQMLGMSESSMTALETTRKLNAEYRVLSSISGTVLERKVTIGQIVQPAEIAFMVADLSNVWLVADLPEQNAGHIMVGKVVDAKIPALGDHVIKGKLSFVSATVSPETRTVRVRMNLPNPQGIYKPAMLAVMVLEDRPQRQLTVPATAVVREENEDHVFVQNGDHSFVLRQVTLGEESGDDQVVTDGLHDSDQIVLDGSFHLNNERKRLALQGGA